jgi:hypothetical protein
MEKDVLDNFAEILGCNSIPNAGNSFNEAAFGNDAFGGIAQEYTNSLKNPLSGYNTKTSYGR